MYVLSQSESLVINAAMNNENQSKYFLVSNGTNVHIMVNNCRNFNDFLAMVARDPEFVKCCERVVFHSSCFTTNFANGVYYCKHGNAHRDCIYTKIEFKALSNLEIAKLMMSAGYIQASTPQIIND